MSSSFNSNSFKEALAALPVERQRRVAARFIEKVLDLADERCMNNIVSLFKEEEVDSDVLAMAYRRAQSIYVETHPGSDLAELNFCLQAKHFVAEACRTCVTPGYEREKECHLAQKVAMYCRMARTCSGLHQEGEEADFPQGEAAAKRCVEEQYEVLRAFLDEG